MPHISSRCRNGRSAGRDGGAWHVAAHGYMQPGRLPRKGQVVLIVAPTDIVSVRDAAFGCACARQRRTMSSCTPRENRGPQHHFDPAAAPHGKLRTRIRSRGGFTGRGERHGRLGHHGPVSGLIDLPGLQRGSRPAGVIPPASAVLPGQPLFPESDDGARRSASLSGGMREPRSYT